METVACRITKTQSLLIEKIIKRNSITASVLLKRCIDKYLDSLNFDDDEEIKQIKKLKDDDDKFYLATERIKMQLKKSSLIPNANKLLSELKQKGVSADDRLEMKKLILERIKVMYGVESEEYQRFLNDKNRRD
jgi:hypothetical protein